MTEILLPVGAGLLLLAVVFVALACYSLREFSRSRLEGICERENRADRFGIILKFHEQATLGCELFLLITVTAFVFVAASWQWPEGVAVETETLGPLVITAAALLFASVALPWSLSRVSGERFLFRFWPMIAAMLKVAGPALWFIGGLDKLIHRLSGRERPAGGDVANITDEILTVVDEGEREGLLESEATTMIHRVMELQEADVADIMIPRTDMTCIQVDSTLDDARQRLLQAGHSRVPVIGESNDDIIGILYAKDLLRELNRENGGLDSLRAIVREPFYVPETTGIDTLLQTLKRERVHMAVVLDEYGGVAGLVTMEDILEEIVGEIVDEYDAAVTEQFRTVGPGLVEVDARVRVDDVNERLGLHLPTDRDFDTVGGFAFAEFGRIPKTGDTFEWDHTKFVIVEADKRKIVRISIRTPDGISAKSKGETSVSPR